MDWQCEVHTLFRTEHLSVKYSISSAIDWFFKNEAEGIILEDDVLPIPTFFLYCDELLEKYRHDKRIGVISGSNFISKRFTTTDSYYFSRYNHIWGWASWRRAWCLSDISMKAWPSWRDSGGLNTISDGNKLIELYWEDEFNRTYHGVINTWDFQWRFTCWYYGMLTAVPIHNQTYNLGFGPDAVHTKGEIPDYLIESIPKPVTFPLSHPYRVERSVNADALLDRFAFGITRKEVIRRNIRRLPLIGYCLKKIKILRKKI